MEMVDEALSSRSFVLGMVGADGVLHADEVYDVGEAVGFTRHQLRLCLARLVQEGLFAQQGRGRRAVFSGTDAYERRSAPEVEYLAFAYRQDAGLEPWDGFWHAVGFTIGEERRRERNTFRELLNSMGAAMTPGGWYVHGVDWDQDVRSAAIELGVEDAVVLARIDRLEFEGVTEPRDLAARLWPLDEIDVAYRGFLARWDVGVEADDAAGLLAQAVALSAAFEACIREDPLLPPELLGDSWPGPRARVVLRDMAAQLGRARADAGVPALFARYDCVFDEASEPRAPA